MARPAQHTDGMIQLSKQLIKNAKTANDLRTGLSVMIPYFCNMSNAQAAELLEVSVATLVRMKKQVRDQSEGRKISKNQWGGRRRQNLTLEQEKEFLTHWVDKAGKEGELIVSEIHEALEKRLDRKVAVSTVYRMLVRHGWRKVTPDHCRPRHPFSLTGTE